MPPKTSKERPSSTATAPKYARGPQGAICLVDNTLPAKESLPSRIDQAFGCISIQLLPSSALHHTSPSPGQAYSRADPLIPAHPKALAAVGKGP